MKLKIFLFKHAVALWSLIFLLGGASYAQSSVSGRITSSDGGDAVAGATVLVMGTTSGTYSDAEGRYTISVPEGGTSLMVSFLGYERQEVTIGGRSTIDIGLAASISTLEEVVVVGYGTVKRKDATGSVTSISTKDFNKGVVVSPEDLIQGRAAGVQITQTSGEPGAGINIRIRGTSSVRGGNNPLFVVDGVPLSGENTTARGSGSGLGSSSPRNPLNFLNPSDIASIDILKDASATAIYGSRGANGVVIITTKGGQKGAGKVGYDYSLGVSTISQTYDLLGREEFLAAYTTFNGAAAAASLDGGSNTDWQDEAFRTAITQSHNLNFGGGDDQGNYRFSLSYQDQQGIFEESGMKRITGRFNGNRKFIDDRLTIGTQLIISNIHDDGVAVTENSGFRGDLMGNVLKANPTTPVRDANGDFVQLGITEPNPIAILNLSESFTNTLRALGNISGELKITDDLKFKTVLGLDRSFSNRTDAFSRDLVVGGVNGIGRLYLNDVEVSNVLWENYFTYEKDFGNISLNALAGYSYQQFDYRTRGSQYANFRTGDLDVMINNLASSDQNGNLASSAGTNSSRSVDELQSYFGRVNLNIGEKYLVTGTLRADGSTRFGEGNQIGYFPSFAVKWRLAEEDFVPDVFDDLSLRVGYGITGNQEIPHNLYQERQRYGDFNIDEGAGNVTGGGLGSVAFANPNLKWESTTQINVGVDYAFANGRIYGSLDYYDKNTNDLLIQVTAAQPAVQDFVWTNLDADVKNRGVELALNVVPVQTSDFQWTISFNVAYNDNIVENFSGLINTGDIDGQGLTGAFAQRIAEGQPLFAYFLREFGGYDENGITIYEGGDFQQFVGKSPLPVVTGGLTNSLSYKNFDFSIFFTGQYGHYIYSNTANAFFTAGSLANGRNVTRDVVGNGEGNLNAPDVSTRFLESGDFTRLQNISLGYNVDTGNSFISNARFFATAQNLAVFTSYSGQDPEVSVNKQIGGVPSAGIDYTTYPRSRTFTVGVSLDLK